MMLRVVAAATLLACSTAGGFAIEPKPQGSPAARGYNPVGKDERGLWAQADEAERDLKSSKLLVRDEQVTAYLRKVLCRTVGDEACASIRLYLVRAPIFNASMAPNGVMTVYTGLLLRVRDEAELAAVLAHEFTHFEKRHGLGELRKRRNNAGWAAWLTVASGLTNRPTNYFPTFFADVQSYNRDQEREADIQGLKLMHRGGYRTMAASSVWMHQREEQDAQAAALGVKSLKDEDYGPFASHPMDAERMTYLAREAQALGTEQSFEGVEEFRAALVPIWPMLIDDQIKLNDFGASEYILANLARGTWTGPLLFARAELHRARNKGLDLLTAETLYRQAIVRDDAPAAAWRGLGLVLTRTGKAEDAAAAIKEYLKRKPDAPDRAMLAAIAEGQ
jgi:beta-barrel assembly-enhancing protease